MGSCGCLHIRRLINFTAEAQTAVQGKYRTCQVHGSAQNVGAEVQVPLSCVTSIVFSMTLDLMPNYTV